MLRRDAITDSVNPSLINGKTYLCNFPTLCLKIPLDEDFALDAVEPEANLVYLLLCISYLRQDDLEALEKERKARKVTERREWRRVSGEGGVWGGAHSSAAGHGERGSS